MKSTAADKDAKLQQLQQKVFFVEKFIQSKQLITTNPQEMIKIRQQLIENVILNFNSQYYIKYELL